MTMVLSYTGGRYDCHRMHAEIGGSLPIITRPPRFWAFRTALSRNSFGYCLEVLASVRLTPQSGPFRSRAAGMRSLSETRSVPLVVSRCRAAGQLVGSWSVKPST